MEEKDMNKLTGFLTAMVFAISFSNVYAQDHSQHQSAAATAGTDPMAHLESDMDEIRNTKDASKRKELLTHHLQMMQEHIQALTAMEHVAGSDMQGMDHSKMGAGGDMQGMDHSKMGAGGDMQGMDHGAMMQHHEKMVKLLQHMLETQEQILGLIETK
jgi:hypothetical protein